MAKLEIHEIGKQNSYPDEIFSNSISSSAIPNVFIGLIGHFWPLLTYLLGLCFIEHTPISVVLLFFVISGAFATFMPMWEAKHGEVELPSLTKKDIVAFGEKAVTGTGIAGFCTLLLAAFIGTHFGWIPETPTSWFSIILTVVIVDFLVYAMHRWGGHNRLTNKIMAWYRRAHSNHHNVEHLDMMRASAIEVSESIFGLIIPVVGVVFFLGLDPTSIMLAFCLYLLGPISSHVNIPFNIGFLRYIFMENRAHKFHHCIRGHDVNFGGIFSIWDRLLGTYFDDTMVSPGELHKNRKALKKH